jgi:MOSC domain-containing protein YiiM
VSDLDVQVAIAELRSGAVVSTPAARTVGRVLQVNTSPGGVPKLPVAAAYVDQLGLTGDGHSDSVSHGGPLAAVSLLAIEAVRRVAADGNPIAPGTTGENVTTEGVEWGALPLGTRVAVGPELVIELTKHVVPCKTIAHNFTDGRFARLSAKVHPLDTRLYASVIHEGTIRPGDTIAIVHLPPDEAAGDAAPTGDGTAPAG